MKILIAADMEGVTGVVSWDHVDPNHAEYARFRKLMTGDVNAAIRGALEGGAEEVIVADGHNTGRNILVEELDPRARLNSGGPTPFSMVEGVDSGIAAAILIGYHARVGSLHAVLDHTWSAVTVANLWLNGQLVGEIGLNAAVCGHFGAPVIMVSGDQTACAEGRELLGNIEVAVVKQASSRMAAALLPPQVSQQRIQEAAERAVRRLAAGDAPPPLLFDLPLTVTLETSHTERADRMAILPGLSRLEARKVEFTAPDVPTAYRIFRAAVSLARE